VTGKSPLEHGYNIAVHVIQEASRLINAWIEDNSTSIQHFGQLVTQMNDDERLTGILNESGWLLHNSTPREILNDAMSKDEISATLEKFYQRNWNEVANKFRANIKSMPLDEEMTATFNEALIAHGHGLYRCTTRVILPEIERYSRLVQSTQKKGASIRHVRNETKLEDTVPFHNTFSLKALEIFLVD